MRLDMKHEAESIRRRGLAGRTVVSTVWLVTSFILAYLVAGFLAGSGSLDANFFYRELSVPESVSPALIRIIFAAVIAAILQFFLLIGFALTNPAARARPGTPSAQSTSPDLYESRHLYH